MSVIFGPLRESNTIFCPCNSDLKAVGLLGLQSLFTIYIFYYIDARRRKVSRMEYTPMLLFYPLFALFDPLNPKSFAVRQIRFNSKSLILLYSPYRVADYLCECICAELQPAYTEAVHLFANSHFFLSANKSAL